MMTGQAGHIQPSGQVAWRRASRKLGAVFPRGALALCIASVLLVIPFNRGGIWDPHELRVAELARRLSIQLFPAGLRQAAPESVAIVTRGQLGQGELGITSPALGFALLGVSDWSGRVTSLFWGMLALFALWLLLGRIADRVAQGFGVLLLVSTPLFAWQARSMLGDAATIGTWTLAVVGLALLQFDRSVTVSRWPWARRLVYFCMALTGLFGGIFCRGVIYGVAIPCLSVGLVALCSPTTTPVDRNTRAVALILVVVGGGAAIAGVRETLYAAKGFSLLLGATLAPAAASGPFDVPFTRLLHQLFPIGAFVPFACVVALEPRRRSRQAGDAVAAVATALALSCVLCLSTAALMSTRNVVTPFPAVSAVAAISGIAIARLHQRTSKLAYLGVFVAGVSAIAFADFINFPEKSLLMTGVFATQFPEAFQSENQMWLRLSLAIAVVGCGTYSMASLLPRASVGRFRDGYLALYGRLRTAFGGQLMSGLVLVETAMVTTALLQRAHDQGWISVPAFDRLHGFIGPVLSWAWVLPPLVLFVLPLGLVSLHALVDWMRTEAWRHFKTALGLLAQRLRLSGLIVKLPDRVRATPSLIWGGTLALAGLFVTMGHAPAMAEQLSPKRTILQYRAHAKADEPLALLGIRPEAAAYYVHRAPTVFMDVEAAARWLHESGEQRRWVSFEVDHFAELNAAYRVVSGRRNLNVVDAISSNLVLATNQLLPMETEYNPFSSDVLVAPPTVANACDVHFGDIVRLIGWEFRSSSGAAVTRLTPGQSYELRLVFEVVGSANVDWELFVHIDGHGKRHNGDHDPLHGRYPTTLWIPGDIVVDRHKIVLERGAFAGSHVIYVGLFRGNKRLDVTAGIHDDNRAKLGELLVQ